MEFMKTEAVELLFLDIHLPKISGIEFLKSLQSLPYVIFTTAFSEYALEGYELNVVDYLLKPFSFQRFVQAINKVPKNQGVVLQKPEQDSQTTSGELYIKSGHEFLKVAIDEIDAVRQLGLTRACPCQTIGSCCQNLVNSKYIGTCSS